MSGDVPPLPPVSAAGWVRVLLRGAVLSVLLLGGLAVLLIFLAVERVSGRGRGALSRSVPQIVSRMALIVLGIGYRTRGRPMDGPGAVVANHSSWLDIFALNAQSRICFVSKSEVAAWPVIGWLARATGTVFITRAAREARGQKILFEGHLGAGHRLLFFPEGTSADGQRVLPFKSSLFAAFFAPSVRPSASVQPITLIYQAPPGADPRFYGWWGDMEFGPHLLHILAARRQGAVTLIVHPPLRARDFADRKALAAACEAAVRAGLPDEVRARAGS